MFSAGTTKPQEYNDDLANIFGTLLKQLNQKDIAELEALPHVEDVHQDYNLNAQFITREGAKRYTGFLQAYNPAQKPEMKAGEAPEALPNGSVLMSDEYVSRLKFKNPKDALGKTITLQLRKLSGGEEAKQYKVAGVTTKTTLGIDFVPDGLYLSEDDARAANDYVNGGTVLEGRVPTATVRGDGTITPDELKKQITDLGYAARTAEDAQAFLNQIISVLQGIIVLFGLITLIASFFGVVNTQYISVLERTREIGLMKALGASKRTVSRLFMVEATWIGFLGALLGSLAAMALGSALNPVISKQLNFGDEKLLIFEPGQIIALIIFLMLVTTIAGLLPARKAAKLDPIEALRTE
jgi:putative ABC transport system permease protein